MERGILLPGGKLQGVLYALFPDREWEETMKPSCSTQKLITYLKSAKVDTSGIDNVNRYLYGTGRNSLVDTLLVSIYCGDFDNE
jgi:hypothetical protein